MSNTPIVEGNLIDRIKHLYRDYKINIPDISAISGIPEYRLSKIRHGEKPTRAEENLLTACLNYTLFVTFSVGSGVTKMFGRPEIEVCNKNTTKENS